MAFRFSDWRGYLSLGQQSRWCTRFSFALRRSIDALCSRW